MVPMIQAEEEVEEDPRDLLGDMFPETYFPRFLDERQQHNTPKVSSRVPTQRRSSSFLTSLDEEEAHGLRIGCEWESQPPETIQEPETELSKALGKALGESHVRYTLLTMIKFGFGKIGRWGSKVVGESMMEICHHGYKILTQWEGAPSERRVELLVRFSTSVAVAAGSFFYPACGSIVNFIRKERKTMKYGLKTGSKAYEAYKQYRETGKININITSLVTSLMCEIVGKMVNDSIDYVGDQLGLSLETKARAKVIVKEGTVICTGFVKAGAYACRDQAWQSLMTLRGSIKLDVKDQERIQPLLLLLADHPDFYLS